MVVGLNPTQKKKENVHKGNKVQKGNVHKGDKGQKGNKERLIERIKRIFISSSKTAQNTPQKKIKNTQNICVCQKIFVPLCSKIRKYQNTKIKKVKSTKEKNVRQRKDYHNKRGTCWSRVLYKVRRYYFTS